MCMMSMVMDHYRPYFPPTVPYTPIPQPQPWRPSEPREAPPAPVVDPAELRELIEAFRKAVEAAEAFDRLTGQPDCVDPEKATLEERVAKLERQLEELNGTN